MPLTDLSSSFARAVCCAMSLVLTIGALPALAQDRAPLRLATQVLPPYQMIENGEMTGVAVERVRCALDGMGQPHEFHMMDWSAAQLMTENGDMDGFFVGSSNSARERFSVPSEPVVREALTWYMRPGSVIDPTDPEERLSARYSAKFATSKWLLLHREGFNVVMKPRDAESLLAMLVNGDIDVALEYDVIFEYYIRARGMVPSDFRQIPHQLNTMSVHFAKPFLDARPSFLAAFNAQLTQCMRQEE